jgi:hypothetical protein
MVISTQSPRLHTEHSKQEIASPAGQPSEGGTRMSRPTHDPPDGDPTIPSDDLDEPEEYVCTGMVVPDEAE